MITLLASRIAVVTQSRDGMCRWPHRYLFCDRHRKAKISAPNVEVTMTKINTAVTR